MGALPDIEDLVGNPTEAQFQSGLGALYEYLFQVVTSAPKENLDILDGEITPLNSTYLVVDTENDTVSDFLERISPENIGEKMIFVRIFANGHTIILRHLAGGSGQMFLAGKADLTMDDDGMLIGFRYDAASDRWIEQFRNWGIFAPTETAKTAARLALALGSAALLNTGTAPGAIPLNSDLGALSKKSVIDAGNLINNGLLTPAHFAAGTPNYYLGFGPDGAPISKQLSVRAYHSRPKIVYFTAGSHTWNIPANCYGAKVTLIGGGGGGGGKYQDSGGTTGGTGGNTSILYNSTTLGFAYGGQGGGFNSGGTHGLSRGTNIGDWLNHSAYNSWGAYGTGGTGGGSGARNGGQGAMSIAYLEFTDEMQGGVLNITVGGQGNGGGGGSGTPGTAGVPGILIIEYYLTYSPNIV